MEDSGDWIIDADGFYIATRSFLTRRGYCCANQCRNCPYINWRNSPLWRPLEAAMIHIAKVSPTLPEADSLARVAQEVASCQEPVADS
jgi:hypothetical protein